MNIQIPRVQFFKSACSILLIFVSFVVVMIVNNFTCFENEGNSL